MDYDIFVNKINSLQKVVSLTGVEYSELRVFHGTIIGRRMSTNKRFFFSAYDLHCALNLLPIISIQSLENYVNGYESPALAILLGIKAIEPTSLNEKDLESQNCFVLREVNGEYTVMTKKKAAIHDSRVNLQRAFQKLREQEEERKLKLEIGKKILDGSFPVEKKSDGLDKNLNLGCLITVIVFIIIVMPLIISQVEPKGFGDGVGIVIIFAISFVVLHYIWKCYKNQ